ncbi:peptidyl-tRNA hydrolase [Methanobrevibacter thaueri]|jgi:PTH2 family peptidyl-tRNA hydrolase|uniref:Peptidyl-tRNA hydrolase n=3 Tax=Methanobacteriaceae TaxID=2159 RepID=A0A315XKZ6_9EURY|nr:peptidyl-tRNA hydrolase [Methanobrevibacter thaueri]
MIRYLISDSMKQVMIVRTDLKMRKGKIAAQCCHGSIGAYKKSPADKVRKWENEAYAKVILKVQTLEELTALKKVADEKGIANYLVVDAGRTQIPTSSVTVLALGPDEDDIIDEVTGDLKLL